jgi:hypothetical protein
MLIFTQLNVPFVPFFRLDARSDQRLTDAVNGGYVGFWFEDREPKGGKW